MHILLIEDDLDLGTALQAALRLEGFTSQWLRRVHDAPTTLIGTEFDAVLLDLSLPDGDGLSLLARWRREGVAVPLVVITARGSLDDRLTGLNGGADDYIVKPFEMPELVARLNAVLRRSARQLSECWAWGDLQIKPREREVRVAGQVQDLSPREFDLLVLLAREAGKVMPKGLVAQKLAPLGEAVDFSTLEVHVSNLRRKIGATRIRTLRGVGYQFVP